MAPTEVHGSLLRRLVFATRNEGKVREMLTLLQGSGWTVERLPDDLAAYEETGESFAANARGKALSAASALRVPTLADDSGLVVDALGGAPGVFSARYLGEATSQQERNRAILEKLAHTPAARRTARFVCHLTLADETGIVHETRGVCEGSIGTEARGEGGFGYDPIFVLPDLGKTFAEVDRELKSARSHRGIAARAMAGFLRRWDPA